MPGYITLFKWTKKGLSEVKASPERIKANRALVEKMGGRLIGVWVTMGEYDLIAVSEAPDDQTAARVALLVAGSGYATTQTMRAFSEDEFAEIVGKLP